MLSCMQLWIIMNTSFKYGITADLPLLANNKGNILSQTEKQTDRLTNCLIPVFVLTEFHCR